MVKGDVVTIFEDPITQKEPEGTARLERLNLYGERGSESWEVQFEDLEEGFFRSRWVYPPKEKEGV